MRLIGLACIVLCLAAPVVLRAADSVKIAVIDVGGQVNPTRTALERKGQEHTVVSAKNLADKNFKLNKFDIILLNEWWIPQTRDALNSARERIVKFVASGGVLVVFFSLNSACDIEYWTSSWTPFPMYAVLNNEAQDCRQPAAVYHDEIELEGHPLFQGLSSKFLEVGERKAFRTTDSHWYRLAQNRDQEQATILEATHEKGRYLVVGPALAPWYGKRHQETILFDNIIAYTRSAVIKFKQDEKAEKQRLIEEKKQQASEQKRLAEERKLQLAQEKKLAAEEKARQKAAALAAKEAAALAAKEAAALAAKPTIPAAAPTPAPVNKPELSVTTTAILPLKAGNTWSFGRSVWYIAGNKLLAGKEAFVLDFSSGLGMYYLGQEFDGIYLYGSAQGGVDNITGSPQIMFKYPATTGESYRTGMTIGGGEAQITVTSIDRVVTTPAGTFTCYEYTVDRNGEVQQWYLAPNTGFVKLIDRGESLVVNKLTLY